MRLNWPRPPRLAGAKLVRLGLAALLGVNVLIFGGTFAAAWAMTHVQPGPNTQTAQAGAWTSRLARPRVVEPDRPERYGLNLATGRVALPDGGWLETWEGGPRDAHGLVIIFHGMGASKGSMLPEARIFQELGWQTLLVDFRGAGHSTGTDMTVGMKEADDVAVVYADAKARHPGTPIVLFGESLGAAAVSKALAEGRVDAEAVILTNPFDRLSTATRRRYTANAMPPAIADLTLVWGGLQHGVEPFKHNPVDYARSFKRPTLVMIGDGDPWTRPEEAGEIVQAIPAPVRGKLVVLRASGHAHLAVVQPTAWREAVRDFLTAG